jgi:uncharacterized phage-like protein YoqJ
MGANVHINTKMMARNRWIVDNSNVIVACWNKQRDGGTFECLRYAKQMNTPVWIIDPTQFFPEEAKDGQEQDQAVE